MSAVTDELEGCAVSQETKYMTLEEVAELLGVRYNLIYRLVRSGEIPASRIGRVYRVASPDLKAYLEGSKQDVAGRVCSACGKAYSSKLSLTEGCKECEAPICRDCWTRKGVRHCTEHEHTDGSLSKDEDR